MFLVAVTGGIACGKSTVSKKFVDLGCPVIDADQIAREGNIHEVGVVFHEKFLVNYGNRHTNNTRCTIRQLHQRAGSFVGY